MLAFRAVAQTHQASNQLLSLLDDFRRIVNVCIEIGIEKNVSSLEALSLATYHRLSKNVLGYYRLGAISTASRILKNYRRAKRKNSRTRFPHARRLMLTTCYGFKIQDEFLRLPVEPYRYTYIRLNSHTLKVLSGMKARSVTLTRYSFTISYAKEVVQANPEGYIGIDRNLDNVTIASTDQAVRKFDLSRATVIKSTYRLVKSRCRRNDSRIRQVVYDKYGERQRNRIQPILHNVSKKIVEEATTRRYGIVMERLSHMRSLYRRGNWRSKSYRAKMNSWSYGELRRQIEYKARWEGVRVVYVPAKDTTKRCSICGYKTLESAKRQLWCPRCRTIMDRDENAARNIAARGLRFGPNGPPVEAMVEEREPAEGTLILKVDGGKSTQQPAVDRTT
ncbi:MAG: hypothetical protein AUG17_07845 [Crenarchaeota archaeon 13_1_20CM_2_53_14]|nr:MAG: hypothetical protein AUI07_04320 [archaeon 13_2_20CM_2_53_6]OLE58397.1 MAG: hypothetical protein AUG17_07845 [Crenarchaeota archaeon 13_1_20CM_2_53_14]